MAFVSAVALLWFKFVQVVMLLKNYKTSSPSRPAIWICAILGRGVLPPFAPAYRNTNRLALFDFRVRITYLETKKWWEFAKIVRFSFKAVFCAFNDVRPCWWLILLYVAHKPERIVLVLCCLCWLSTILLVLKWSHNRAESHLCISNGQRATPLLWISFLRWFLLFVFREAENTMRRWNFEPQQADSGRPWYSLRD